MVKNNNYLKNILLVMVCFCFIIAISSACAASDIDNGTLGHENSIKTKTNYNEMGVVTETLVQENSIDENTIDAEMQVP